MPERARRWPWIVVPAVLIVATVVAAALLVRPWTRPTRVLIVNGGPAPLTDVAFRVECDGRETGTFAAPRFGPGESWEIDVTDTGKVPWMTLAWREADRELRHREQTDLWVGETWRIELLPGGRVKSGYWRDGSGWCAESEGPAGVFPR